MKWPWTPPPKHGDIRKRVVFALLPRPCTDGYWHWLEYVEVSERFDEYGMDVPEQAREMIDAAREGEFPDPVKDL